SASTTRSTLDGSATNLSPNQIIGPPEMTLAVSRTAAKKVAKLIVAFSSGAQPRWPVRASRRAPRSGSTRTSAISKLVFLQLFHMPDIEAVEALADMEEKYSEYEGADQHVERHAQLHYEGHAVSGAGGGEEETVFHRQKPDDLRHRFLAHDHHEERKQHARERDPQRRARERGRHLRNRRGQGKGEYHQADPDQHGRRNIDQSLDVPAHEQAVDQPVQQPRNEYDLEQHSQHDRNVKVILPGRPRDDGRGGGERGALPGEEPDERQHAPLRQHRERDQQKERGEHVDQLGEERNSHVSLSPGNASACRARRAGTRSTGTPARGTGAASRAASRSARGPHRRARASPRARQTRTAAPTSRRRRRFPRARTGQ